jgi:hypothetical protein
VGAYFGVTSRNGHAQARAVVDDQVERERLLGLANTNALIADVLFGVVGAAALGAVIALFATPTEPVAESGK